MANMFDQFDSATAPADAGGNVFDQFDAQPPKRYGSGKSFDVAEDGSLVPSRSDYGAQDGPESGKWIQAAKNVGEAGASFGTGLVGGLAGDVAGLGAAAYDITANAIMHPFSGSTPGAYADPSAVRERVANFLTYRPSDPNSATNQVLSFPGRVFGESGQYLKDKATDITGNPYIGDVAGALPIAAANIMGAKAALPPSVKTPYGRMAVPEVPPGTPRAAPRLTPEEQAIKNANAAGYKLAPDQAGGKIGSAVQGAAGSAVLERELSVKNAPITDSLAATEIGLPKGARITPQAIQQLKKQVSAPYAELSKTGKVVVDDAFRADVEKIADRSGSASFAEDTPAAIQKLKDIYSNKKGFDAGDAVAKIRSLRADASANIKARNAPEQNALGYAQQKLADALDQQLARHVKSQGLTDLAERYAKARVQLAKIHSVEDALQGANVSAKRLSQQKARGIPLSGNLKLIADTYDAFDRVLQEPRKIRNRGPVSALDYIVGVGGAAYNPALAAAVLARPAARRLLATDTYQHSLVPKGENATPLGPRGPNKLAAPAAVAPQSRERRAR